MREAVAGMVRLTSVRTVAERMNAEEATAGAAPPAGLDWPPAGLPDPDTAPSYEALLAALRQLIADAGLTCQDIERATDGRLAAPRVTAIIDGVLPASGEQYVLLLRTCGLREQIPRWITAWSRLRGSHLGNPPAPSGRPAALLNAIRSRLTGPRRPAAGRCALVT